HVRAPDHPPLKPGRAAPAAALIAEGEAVVIDTATPGAAAAPALASRRLRAVPLSVQAIAALSGSPGVDLVLPGGSVRKPEGTLVGPATERSIAALRFDTAVMTCCAASPQAGVMAYDLGDAAVKQAIRAASARTLLIAEGAKFTRSALAVVCPLEEIDVLVTDDSAPAAVLDRLRAAGVHVEVC
uniref:DeoR/GlpR family DNA-binding transcription regulator n=1 Tax=Kineococcus sp. SYSU DK005 TaxID=3383126 RepID=UPI003D7E7040